MDKISLYNMLKANATLRPDKLAIVYDTFEVSYSMLFEDVKKKALHLSKFEGNRIAIYGPASYRWIVNVFGTILAGKDIVIVDFFLPHAGRDELFSKTNVDYTLSSTNQYILSDVGCNIIAEAEKDDVLGLTYDESTTEGNFIFFTAIPDESDKPVTLSVQNILHTAEVMKQHVDCTEEDIFLSQIPLNHIFGLIYSLIWPLCCGSKVCIGRGLRHIDADTYYYHPTILPGTPSMLDYLRRVNGFNEELKKVVIGAAGCPFRLYENLSDIDLDVYNVYGMTEASGCIGINDLFDGSFALFEPENIEIASDGEILVKGECVMQGYTQDEETTQKVITDGVYHTGDYGRINDAGRLILIKRNPDLILLPTGDKISRKRTNEKICALNGVADSFITFYNNKLTAVIEPIDKSEGVERFKRRIDKFNEKNGYRWEIQKIVLTKEHFPCNENNEPDEAAIQDLIDSYEA